MNFIINRNKIMMMLISSISLYHCISASGQDFNVHKLGHEALAQGANTAAAYFLYADYLRNPSDFNDLEITAYLLSEMGEYAKADSLLQRISTRKRIDELPDSLNFYYYASRAKVDNNRNRNIEALQNLSKIQLNHNLTELQADCCEELGLYDNALQAYLSILTDDNQARINCLIASCYRQMGKYSEAIEYYSRALNVKNDWAYPYYGIGWSYELSGDDDNALKYYNEGLSVDQSYAYLFLMRGEMLLKHGQKELADEDFHSVLRIDKTIEDGTCRQYALFFLGRNEDAMNWMNRVIDFQPNEPGNYYDKACLCSRMGLLNEAIEAVDLMFQKGYRKFAHLDADDDLDPIKNMPEYIELYNKYHSIYMEELEQLKSIL